MTYNFFITTVIIYLISLVTSLILMMVGTRIHQRVIHTIMIFHFLLLVIFLVSWLSETSGGESGKWIDKHLVFLACICSGVMLSGYAIRMAVNVIIRVYFSLFILTLPVFVYSPSTLISSINFHDRSAIAGKPYPTGLEYYYIEKHNSVLANMEGVIEYKIVKQKNKIKRTIVRHIRLSCEPDNIRKFSIQGDSLIIFELLCPGQSQPEKYSIRIPVNSVHPN
ncbi:MAG: hypothetical protein LC117_02505 [Bacteroidia bacterium]|nr:hypothetical protein [Bacteroidia bacterium]MCZ2276786.1 hypothetical protein [Bacteroidia bacterium]